MSAACLTPCARRLGGPVLTLSLLLAVSTPSGAGAQAAPPQAQGGPPRVITQSVSTNPLATPFGFLSGEYERALGRRGVALGVGGITSVGRDPQALNDGGSDVFRSLQLKLKYYPRQAGLRGVAVGLTVGVAHERELWYGSSTIDAARHEVWLERVTRARTAPTVGTTIDYNVFLGRERRFLLGLGVGARRPLGVRAHSGPLDGPLVDPRLQLGFGF